MTTVVAADPEGLRRSAEQVRFAAHELNRSVTARGGGLAVPAQHGWRSAGELGAAAEAWTDHIGSLAAEIEELAVGLRALATTLAAADAEATTRWDPGVVRAGADVAPWWRGLATARARAEVSG